MKPTMSAHDCARSTLKISPKRINTTTTNKTPYADGSVIYRLDTVTVKYKSRKLSAPWKGRTLIVKKLPAYLYRVKLRNAIFVVNHDRMMPCKDRKMPEWITKLKKLQGNISGSGRGGWPQGVLGLHIIEWISGFLEITDTWNGVAPDKKV